MNVSKPRPLEPSAAVTAPNTQLADGAIGEPQQVGLEAVEADRQELDVTVGERFDEADYSCVEISQSG
jgi:hypothetical protein